MCVRICVCIDRDRNSDAFLCIYQYFTSSREFYISVNSASIRFCLQAAFVPQPESIDDTSYFLSRFGQISSGFPDDQNSSNSDIDTDGFSSNSGIEVSDIWPPNKHVYDSNKNKYFGFTKMCVCMYENSLLSRSWSFQHADQRWKTFFLVLFLDFVKPVIDLTYVPYVKKCKMCIYIIHAHVCAYMYMLFGWDDCFELMFYVWLHEWHECEVYIIMLVFERITFRCPD